MSIRKNRPGGGFAARRQLVDNKTLPRFVEVGTFLAEAPLIPIMTFMLAIWGIVAFAYYLGWRNIRKINLVEVLRDDTMM